MNAVRLIVLPQADRDIRGAISYYSAESGAALAARFIVALERQYRLIVRHPAAGSPRFETELLIEGLRTARLDKFPYLIFYVEKPNAIEIWRILHAKRDIRASLRSQA